MKLEMFYMKGSREICVLQKLLSQGTRRKGEEIFQIKGR